MSSSGVLVHVAGCALKTFTISATVGLQGQVVRMPIRVEYLEYKIPAVVIEIQKRHKCARFSMDLFSDHKESIPILVQTTLSSGEEVEHYYCVGAKNHGWGFVSELDRKYTCDSVWRIWKLDPEGEDKVEILFTISFKKIKLDKGMLAAEMFYYSDGEDTGDEWEEFVKAKEIVAGGCDKGVKTRRQIIQGIIAFKKENIAKGDKGEEKIGAQDDQQLDALETKVEKCEQDTEKKDDSGSESESDAKAAMFAIAPKRKSVDLIRFYERVSDSNCEWVLYFQ